MDKFWEWMEEKGYGRSGTLVNGDWFMMKIHLKIQMLIGYMYEYARQLLVELDINYQQNGSFEARLNTANNHKNHYEKLEIIINDMELIKLRVK
jgi:hypothetical protein